MVAGDAWGHIRNTAGTGWQHIRNTMAVRFRVDIETDAPRA